MIISLNYLQSIQKYDYPYNIIIMLLIIVLTIIAILLFYQLVHKFVDVRKYKKTIKSYDKAIEINPEDAGAWYNKGKALYDLGKYEEAIKSYDKAIEINPEDAGAWYNKQVGAALLDFPCFGFAHRRYEGTAFS